MRYPNLCLRAALALSLLAAACAGAIDEMGEETGEPARDPRTGEILPGAAPGVSPGSAPQPEPGGVPAPNTPGALPPERMMSQECKAIDPGPSYVRRLTRREYDNTIRDLLGEASQPAKDFPTEERVEGFDNNAAALTVPPVLLEQYLLVADRLATAAVEKSLVTLTGCDPAKEGEDPCARRFFEGFGRRAFRRPPTTEEITLLQGVYAAGKANGGFKGGIRLAMTHMLMSPPFLYRIEVGMPPQPGETVVRLEHHEMASRLSYLLWNSMPDEALFQAARDRKLGTRQEVAAQVQRMLADPKARDVTADFYHQWLELERLDDVSKDAKAFPTFNSGILGAMEQETKRYLDAITWGSDGTLEGLLTAPYTYANATLAKYYGLTGPTGTSFVKANTDGTRRAGLLTQGALLTMLAHANQTSPVLRGRFVREQLLCQRPPDPPNDVVVELPKLDPRLTTRERFTQHATDPACAGCHSLMDPIGLGFENYDAVGLWRDAENGKPIDASGEVRALAGGEMRFSGAVDLGRKLARTPEVRDCVSTKWFQYGYGRVQTDADACSLDVIKRRFATSGYKLKDLLVALTETDAFLFRRVVAPGGAQ